MSSGDKLDSAAAFDFLNQIGFGLALIFGSSSFDFKATKIYIIHFDNFDTSGSKPPSAMEGVIEGNYRQRLAFGFHLFNSFLKVFDLTLRQVFGFSEKCFVRFNNRIHIGIVTHNADMSTPTVWGSTPHPLIF